VGRSTVCRCARFRCSSGSEPSRSGVHRASVAPCRGQCSATAAFRLSTWPTMAAAPGNRTVARQAAESFASPPTTTARHHPGALSPGERVGRVVKTGHPNVASFSSSMTRFRWLPGDLHVFDSARAGVAHRAVMRPSAGLDDDAVHTDGFGVRMSVPVLRILQMIEEEQQGRSPAVRAARRQSSGSHRGSRRPRGNALGISVFCAQPVEQATLHIADRQIDLGCLPVIRPRFQSGEPRARPRPKDGRSGARGRAASRTA